METLESPKLNNVSSITDLLKDEVCSGKWNPDQPISTDKELARRFGVSRSTIIKSLTQLQQDGYIWSRQGKGRFVYKQFIKRRKTWNIGVIISNMSQLTHPVVTKRLAGINSVLQKTQYHLQIFAVNENSNRRPSFGKDLESSNLDGAIICTQPLSLEDVDKLAKEIPLVWLDPPTDNPDIGSINLDFLGGAFVAGRHLVELGHKRIALITADMNKFPVIKNQHDGLRLATMEGTAVEGGEFTIFTGDDFTESEGIKLAEQMLEHTPRPTAVVCGSDELAVGVCQVLEKHKLEIPKDISLIAWNDTPIEKLIPIPLTTVAIDYEKVGQLSIEMLLSKIDDPQKPFSKTTIPMDLIIRKSTALMKK